MIIECPFEEDFSLKYLENIKTSFFLGHINHGDKNIREADLIKDALAYHLESKVGKILLPIQNIFWTNEEEKEFKVYKHQVIAIYNLNDNNLKIGQKNDPIKIDKEEEEKLYIIFNFVYKYYNEVHE